MRTLSLYLLATLLMLGVGLPLHAQSPNGALQAHMDELQSIERELESGARETETLSEWSTRLTNARSLLNTCISEQDKRRGKLSEDLATLGEAVDGEAVEVTRKRRDLQSSMQDVERELASCRVALLRSQELGKRIAAILKEQVAEHLFARGPHLGLLLLDNWNQPGEWLAESSNFLRGNSGIELLNGGQWALLAVLPVVGFAIGFGQRRRMRRRLDMVRRPHGLAERILLSLRATTAHYAPQFLAAFGAAGVAYLLFGEEHPTPFLAVFLYGLPAYFIGLSVIRMFLAPVAPALHFIPVTDSVARALGRRLAVLLLLSFIGYLLFATLLEQALPEPALLLARAVFATVLILNLLWAFWLLARFPRLADIRWLNLGITLILIAILCVEWMGYRNLSIHLLRGVLGSLLAFTLFTLVHKLFVELYDDLDQGREAWAQRIRQALGLESDRVFPGLLWLRLITLVLLWTMLAVALLHLWDAPDTTLQKAESFFRDGFTVGSLRIIPVRILVAIASFALLVALAGWLRTRLDKNWLNRAHVDRGAREAMVTITGYVLITIAILIGLAVAGVDFSNLAIIAGALSVGIGFGLQNIVNNFVSGLILLFERPVKTGDWIVVGSTEGYVKRIRIRSTQIQTFDRADVIVPNSELISNQVTNWMLYDPGGRARIPVGVAYGSDTQLVKQILLELAGKHPSVVTDGSVPQPKVLFLGFGDSSLNFELRCFIANVDERLQVISDLNFAVDAAFREHGVEIPFPQRDLHVRNWKEGGFGE